MNSKTPSRIAPRFTPGTSFVTRARTDGYDLAFLRLFLGGVGNNNAALRLLFAFKAAKDDAVM